MTVKDLTVLGSSSQQPTRTRNHGAYLLRWNEEGFLFDPGEGTQRQFIFANIAPTSVTRILISHFHGDHCLGLGSMLMRLNLDKVQHEIHCYYPASGKVYFDRLRYGSMYHENIKVVEHPVKAEGIVDQDGKFIIEAFFLDHGVENIGWRLQEKSFRKFSKEKLKENKVVGPLVRILEEQGEIIIDGKRISIDDVSILKEGAVVAVVMDTLPCKGAIKAAKGAELLLCESTYLETHRDLAKKHHHLTALQAATIAKDAGAKMLILTHFSARYQELSGFEEEAKKIFPNTFIGEDLKTFLFPQ
jgi:ribonuclease Z